MKKIMIFLCAAVLALSVTACSSEPEHTLSYEGSERVDLLEQFDCVAVYTQYTNGSAETYDSPAVKSIFALLSQKVTKANASFIRKLCDSYSTV